MSRRQKVLILVWGLLFGLMGAGAGVAFLLWAVRRDFEWSLAAMEPVLAGLGGVLLALCAVQSLRERPSTPLRLPRGRVLVAAFVLALAAGLFFWGLKFGRAFSVPICAATAACLPPLAAVAVAMRRRPGRVTTRRAWAALGLGATAGPLLAVIGEIVLPLAVLLLVSAVQGGLPRAGKELSNALRAESVSPEPTIPVLVAAVVVITIVGPIVEEFVKSLPLLPLLKWVTNRRDAFLLGALAGAAFAALENMVYATAAGSDWAAVLAARSMSAAVHPLGAGLTAVAWWGVRRGEPRAARRWWRNYGLAVGVHALWNGTAVAAVALAWFANELLEGPSIATIVLLALLPAEGLGLLIALRAQGRRPRRRDRSRAVPGTSDGGLVPDPS
jgi:RsiW-degrading membrane proteinase PrsW (M82 family)